MRAAPANGTPGAPWPPAGLAAGLWPGSTALVVAAGAAPVQLAGTDRAPTGVARPIPAVTGDEPAGAGATEAPAVCAVVLTKAWVPSIGAAGA